jgi:Family of unknown function (DUF6152)
VSIAKFPIAALCIVLSAPGSAHHSYAHFDSSRKITLHGTVEQFDWANPHTSFQLLVSGPGKAGVATEWTVETHGTAILTRYGWTENSLQRGTLVDATCIPKRDDSPGCRLLTVRIGNSGKVLETKLSHSSEG